MSSRVLLLGARGQLGRLVHAAAPSGVECLAAGSDDVDVSRLEDLNEICRSFSPDVIINAAAYTAVDRAEEEPARAFAVNADGPENLAVTAGPGTRILQVSTDFVFDGAATRPYRPDDATAPLGIYGESKRDGERRLLTARPDSIVLRTAWLYAAEGQNFLNTMLRLMSTRDELRVVSDQVGTPTSAHTLADVIWRLLAAEVGGGIYHWTDQGRCSWFDFAVAIQEEALALGLLDRRIPVHSIGTQDYPTPARRPAWSVLDSSATVDATGFSGRPWREELQRVLRMKSEQQPGLAAVPE